MKLSSNCPSGLKTFKEFWPYYLNEHSNTTNRMMHIVGTLCCFAVWGVAFYNVNFWYLFLLPVVGYGFAWTGHFFVERNKPATFKYPWWSLKADHVMTWYFLTGQLSAEMERAKTVQKDEPQGQPVTSVA